MARTRKNPHAYSKSGIGRTLMSEISDIERAGDRGEIPERYWDAADMVVRVLDTENDTRLEAAKTMLEAFTEAQQDSGWGNVWDTLREMGNPDIGHPDAYRVAEVWELAAASAQSIADFGGE